MTSLLNSAEYALFCRGQLQHPYPFFHRLRSEDPVHWCQPLNSWVLTRYVDVAAALRDPRLSSERVGFFVSQAPLEMQTRLAALSQHLSKWVVLIDAPDHSRLRNLVTKAFTPTLVLAKRDRVQEIVDQLLDEIQSRGESDLIRDFAYRLPAAVISEILGVPSEHHAEFRRWTEDINAFTAGSSLDFAETAERSQASLVEMTKYFHGVIEERRRRPKQDLISAMTQAEEQGDVLSSEELLSMCSMLFVAGHDTTRNLIGNGTLALLHNPEQLARLREDRSLLGSAVEELLRFDSPLQRQTRIAKQKFEIDGKVIRKGQAVLAMLGAANRDPAQFSDPDRLDLGRRINRHLAFGMGIHFCLGAPLARLEGQIAFNSLLSRFPVMQLGAGSVEWRESISVRGLKALPLVFDEKQQRPVVHLDR